MRLFFGGMLFGGLRRARRRLLMLQLFPVEQNAFARVAGFAECGAVPFAAFALR